MTGDLARRPLLVTGIGRSGTSAVARVAHETLGVDMGPDLGTPTAHHPRGTYEDRRFVVLHLQAYRGHIPDYEFRHRARQLIRSRTPPWGVKDPSLCYVADFYHEELPDAIWIVCWRDLDACAESWRRTAGGDLSEHRREIERRAAALEDSVLGRDAHLLLMDGHRSDSWIADRLLKAAPFLQRHANIAASEPA